MQILSIAWAFLALHQLYTWTTPGSQYIWSGVDVLQRDLAIGGEAAIFL